MIRAMKTSVCVSLVVCMCGCVSTPAAGVESLSRWREAKATERKAEAITHYLTAVIFATQGKNEASLEAMAKVPELDPNAITPTIHLIRAYIKNEDFEAALAMCEKAVKQRPDQPNLHIIQGEIYHRFGRYEEAMAAFEKAIEIDPQNVMGYGAMVELQESRNDLTAAVDIYQRLIELNPETPGLHYQLALVLIRINDKDGAIDALRKTLELNPKLIRAQYLLGILFLETNQTEECISQLRTYMERRPNDMDAADNLAGAQARAGRFEQAIALFERILNSNQAQPQHLISSMYLHLRAKRYDEVASIAAPEGGAYFTMLMRAFANQDGNASAELAIKSLNTMEGDLDAECGTFLGNLLYLFGTQDTGIWLNEAITKLSRHGESRVLDIIRARTLMQMEDHEAAITVLESVLTRFGEDQWTHYYLAICQEEAGNFAETERHLLAYMNYIPDDPDVMNFLAYLYAEEGVKLDEALALLEKALEGDPENPYYLDSLGWIYYKQGRADEAVKNIQQAILGMDSDDGVLRDHLGDAYLLKGDVERAREEWTRALRLDPEIEGVQEKLDAHQP